MRSAVSKVMTVKVQSMLSMDAFTVLNLTDYLHDSFEFQSHIIFGIHHLVSQSVSSIRVFRHRQNSVVIQRCR